MHTTISISSTITICASSSTAAIVSRGLFQHQATGVSRRLHSALNKPLPLAANASGADISLQCTACVYAPVCLAGQAAGAGVGAGGRDRDVGVVWAQGVGHQGAVPLFLGFGGPEDFVEGSDLRCACVFGRDAPESRKRERSRGGNRVEGEEAVSRDKRVGALAKETRNEQTRGVGAVEYQRIKKKARKNVKESNTTYTGTT